MANPHLLNEYTKGGLLRLTYQCKDINSAPIDPGDFTVKIKDPTGTVSSFIYGTDIEVVRLDTGLFKIDVSLTESGLWHHRAQVSGLGQSAVERSFFVQPSKFDS